MRGRDRARKRIEREFPEQVARYLNSTWEEGNAIHGENDAADVYERVLNTYFYENCGSFNHDIPAKFAREPLEYSIAELECKKGGCVDL